SGVVKTRTGRPHRSTPQNASRQPVVSVQRRTDRADSVVDALAVAAVAIQEERRSAGGVLVGRGAAAFQHPDRLGGGVVGSSADRPETIGVVIEIAGTMR